MLRANGSEGRSTNDYVKLLPAMKLDSYAVELPRYPWFGTVRPFGGWKANAPTQSLAWYDQFNFVKHDREENFARATLFAAVQAVCAMAVMNYSQFGLYADNRSIRSFFRLAEAPRWEPSDTYCVGAPFEQTPVDFPF